MAAVSSGKSWRDFFERNIHLPPAFDRENAAVEVSTPICISLNSIEGVVGKTEGISNFDCQVCVSLYDLAYHQFFGRQWMGPYTTLHGVGGATRPRLKYNQSIYFHTSIHSANIVCVVELIAVGTDENGRHKKISSGWGIIRVFKDEDMPDSSRNMKLPAQKAQLFYGSPRALYFMDEPIEANPHIKPIPGCELNYTMCTHKLMYKITHLMPENAIIGNNDVLPGISDSPEAGKDRLRKPKLLKTIPCEIGHVSLQLNPTIEKFEDELCTLLHEDRLNMQNRTMDGSGISIVERRLLVGVHNGWCFVEKPQTFHLDTTNISSKSLIPSASPNFRRSQRFKSSQRIHEGEDGALSGSLTLKQKIQIQDLLEDPMFAVVFILEYVIGESLSNEDKKLSKSLQRGNTRSVTLRWAAWNPFNQPQMPQMRVSMAGGPTASPDNEFVYKVPDTAMQDEQSSKTAGGILNFVWGMSGKDMMASLAVPQEQGMPMPLMGSMGSMRSGAPSFSGSEVAEKVPQVQAGKKPPSGRASFQGSIVSLTPMPQIQMGPVPIQAGEQLMPQVQQHPMPMMMAPPAVQPSLQQSMLQSQVVPMQYPQVYAGSVPQQVYYPMQQGAPAGMYPVPPGPPSEMQELRYMPSHAPIITNVPQPKKGTGLSRAAYAKLYSVGFPPILDRNGEPPEVIDPNTHVVTTDLEREQNDPLQCNEIVLQFLAFAKMLEPDLIGSSKTSGTVFFSFQFYRCPQVTTERLLLAKPTNDLTADTNSLPYILQKLDKDGSLLKGAPGLEVRYFMDPAFMKPGETTRFLQHLSQQTLHIDVWDGDSLLLIGSAALDLKYLCRGGMEAVQTTFELDVISTEYQEDPNIPHGEAGQSGGVRPANVLSYLKGKLHLRMANVGYPADPKAVSPAYISMPSKSVVIMSHTARYSAYGGGSLNAVEPPPAGAAGLVPKKRVARAHHVAENNPEVASLLFSKHEEAEPVRDSNREGDAEKKRKLARMQALRNVEAIAQDKPVTLMTHMQEKTGRTRDLKTLEIYRMQTKKDGILNMLSQAISTEHTIHPSFGTTEFFEYVLKNPYNVQQTVQIEWDDKDLSVVKDAREWRHFKQLNQLKTPMEENMFNAQPTSRFPEIFLRPKETVYIPFKFVTFSADQSVQPQGPVDPFRQEAKTKAKPPAALNTRVFKVYFKSEDDKHLSVLQLKIEPQPHIIDQTFRFHSPEQTFLKKSIRLPPLHSLPGAPVGSGLVQSFVRCSDPNIICETKATQQGEPQDVFMKVPLGASPQIKRFFMAVYLDPLLSRPIQIWQFYVHALQRVDVSGVEGQTSRFSLLLRGTQSSRLVRCFSSHPQEMTLYPGEQFMLAAGAVHELNVAVRPMQEGNKFFYLNVVDIEFHQLIRTWLVVVSARAPMVSRAFELILPVGGGKGCSKKITYKNPYPQKKAFILHSNREDLLQFKETHIEIEGGATHTIGLRFVPIMKPGTAEILVFINDDEDKNEETFRVSARYENLRA